MGLRYLLRPDLAWKDHKETERKKKEAGVV